MGIDCKIVELEYPLKSEDKDGNEVCINSIKLGRVKTKHIKLLPKNFFTGENKRNTKSKKETEVKKEDKEILINPMELVPFIAGLSGLPIEKINEVDMTDLLNLVDAVTELLGEI